MTSSPPVPRELPPVAYSIKAAAKALSVSRSTIERLLATGALRGVKIGSRRIIPCDELPRYLQREIDRVSRFVSDIQREREDAERAQLEHEERVAHLLLIPGTRPSRRK